MPNDRIMVHRSTTSKDGAHGAQNTTRLTIDLDGQYSSIAVDAYVDALDILNQVMHGITPPSALKDEGLPQSLSDATRNAKNLLIQAKMLAKALNEIISSGDWLTINDIAAMASAEPAELGHRLAQWEAEGRLFSFNHKGIQLFPIYALDPTRSYQPFESLSEIIAVLATMKNGWLMACWFAFPNSYLGGKSTQDSTEFRTR
ncbi:MULTISPECIES: hypothetical protein [unclassified Pseudomonas]|uniref:hypothetical protein n=1 Tax=unclassified Pseudomonas TaxID=196821 RepID=UPI000D34B911|nr:MULTISPECIES: hypothetical protein [unclassified Pseudomonas]RAU47912.1 hypothetical protein DBP26_005020 [Pseudomonas sp. RIT 409]RAU55394.1 hypothetical protein DBY65_005645 [Pseudomonas sp. RIT 412]